MMILSQDDFDAHITATYPDVTDTLKSGGTVIDYCPYCKAKMGLIITRQEFVLTRTNVRPSLGPQVPTVDMTKPHICTFRCPKCKAERRWIMYMVKGHSYRVLSIPGDSGSEIDEIPGDPPSLRKAYSEAIRAYDSNCPMAAAAMIRRALQIITREILGAPPGNLGVELKWLQGKPNKLGVTLSQDFHDNAYIIKEVANQAAHPDEDVDLLSFTQEDAKDLHTVFLDLATHLFVIPAATNRAKEEMMNRRKLTR